MGYVECMCQIVVRNSIVTLCNSHDELSKLLSVKIELVNEFKFIEHCLIAAHEDLLAELVVLHVKCFHFLHGFGKCALCHTHHLSSLVVIL